MTGRSTSYYVAYGSALTVHVASAVVGFGMLGLSGLYGSWGRHLDSAKELRDLRQFFGTPNRIGRSLWLIPVAGGAALWLNHGVRTLDQAWVIAALVCWVAATVAATGVIWPGEAQIRSLLADAPPHGKLDVDTEERLAALCRPMVPAAAACDVLFVMALGLMVLKPGS